MVACSALTLAWIASGKLSAHFGYDLSSWDLIAGALLVQEAGGHITDLDGTPYRLETRSMLCSNGWSTTRSCASSPTRTPCPSQGVYDFTNLVSNKNDS